MPDVVISFDKNVNTNPTIKCVFHDMIDDFSVFNISIYENIMKNMAKLCGYSEHPDDRFEFCFVPDYDKQNIICTDSLTVTSNVRNVFFRDIKSNECTLLSNIHIFVTKTMK